MRYPQTFILIFSLILSSLALAKKPTTLPIEKKAYKFYKQKKYDEATRVLEPASEDLSKRGLYLLAESYGKNQDIVNEIRILNLINSKFSKEYKAYFKLGQANLKQADVKDPQKQVALQTQAVENFRKSIKANKGYRAAYEQLLKLFRALNNNYEIRTLVKEMIKRFGDRPQYYIELCRNFTEDKFPDQAKINCFKAIELAPSFPNNFVFLATTHIQLGDRKEAGKVISTAAKKFPKSELVNWFSGTFYLEEKNNVLAEFYFRNAIKTDPNSGRSYSGLAQALYNQKKYDESQKNFLKSCQIDKTFTEAYRVAAAELAQTNQFLLSRKFKSEIYKCKQ